MNNEIINKLREVDDKKKFRKGYSEGWKEREDYLQETIEEIKKIGKNAIPELIEVLFDYDWSSIFAAKLIGEIRDEKAIPALIKALVDCDKHDSDFILEESMYALHKMPDSRIPLLVAAINEMIYNKKYYYHLISALCDIPHLETLKFMVNLCNEFMDKENDRFDYCFEIGHFVHHFIEQNNPEVILFLKKLDPVMGGLGVGEVIRSLGEKDYLDIEERHDPIIIEQKKKEDNEKKLKQEQDNCKHDFIQLVNKKDYDVFKCKGCDFVNKVWKE